MRYGDKLPPKLLVHYYSADLAHNPAAVDTSTVYLCSIIAFDPSRLVTCLQFLARMPQPFYMGTDSPPF